MDTVLSIRISSMINIWSLTLMTEEGNIFFGKNFYYVAVATLSASLTLNVANGGFQSKPVVLVHLQELFWRFRHDLSYIHFGLMRILYSY